MGVASLLDPDLTEESIGMGEVSLADSLDGLKGIDGFDSLDGLRELEETGDDEIVGGAAPLIGGAVGAGMIVVGILIIIASYYADEWLYWAVDPTQEGKYWGARSGGILAGLGVAALGGLGGFYMIKASKFWGAMVALVIVGIIVLTVAMMFSSRPIMTDVFGPFDEDALYWAKVAGGITIGIGMLGIIGRLFFKGGKKYAKFKSKQRLVEGQMSDFEDYSMGDLGFEDDMRKKLL